MGDSKKAPDKLPFKIGEIVDTVPVPTERTMYPWPKMKAGQSVIEPKKASSSARSFVAKHRPGLKVVEEAIKDFPDYIRIWFVEDEDAEPGDEAAPGEDASGVEAADSLADPEF